MNAIAPVRLNQPRTIERVVSGQPTSDGAGVKLTRVLTQPLQQRLDPFLMLDAFGSDSADDYIGDTAISASGRQRTGRRAAAESKEVELTIAKTSKSGC